MNDYKDQCWKRYMENMKYEKYEKEDLVDEIIKMQGEIERLHSIIKEVREKIKIKYIIQGGLTSYEVNDLLNELLEILDKEYEENK